MPRPDVGAVDHRIHDVPWKEAILLAAVEDGVECVLCGDASDGLTISPLIGPRQHLVIVRGKPARSPHEIVSSTVGLIEVQMYRRRCRPSPWGVIEKRPCNQLSHTSSILLAILHQDDVRVALLVDGLGLELFALSVDHSAEVANGVAGELIDLDPVLFFHPINPFSGTR